MTGVSARRAATALLLAALGGCAGPDPAPEREAPGPFVWSTAPDPAEVAALRERTGAFLDSPACLAALLTERPDTAHALLLATPPGVARDALVAALPAELATAWRGGPERLQAAEEALRRGADDLRRDEPLGGLPAAWPTASLEARAAYLRLGAAWRASAIDPALLERMLEQARADWTVTLRLEEMRALGAFALGPTRLRAWHRQVAAEALARGRPLVALQQAAAAGVLTASRVEQCADRALLARAHLAAQQPEAALREAEGSAALAQSPVERMRAEALSGQALLLLGQPREAADAWARAQRAAAEAGKEADALRQAINRVTAWLKAGEAALAREAASELRGMAPVGPEAEELLARRAIVLVLAELMSGDTEPHRAADQVDAALARARAAGAVPVIDLYGGLPERLRRGKL